MRPKKQTKQVKMTKKQAVQSTAIVQAEPQKATYPLTNEVVGNLVELLESYPNPKDTQSPEFIYQIIKRGLENFTEVRFCQFLLTIYTIPQLERDRERVLKNVFRIIFGAYSIPISPIGVIQILSLTAHEDRSPLDYAAENLGLFSNFTPRDRETLYLLRPFMRSLGI